VNCASHRHGGQPQDCGWNRFYHWAMGWGDVAHVASAYVTAIFVEIIDALRYRFR
jgi:hypothetical protein